MGMFSQMAAALTHHVSADRLHHISRSIPKIVIVTGDQDHLVHSSNSVYLKQHMPEAELVEWKNTGHGIHLQRHSQFVAFLERVFEEGREAARQGSTDASH